jgi:hypothetical protein
MTNEARILAAFLRAHPQHRRGIKHVPVDGTPELAMDDATFEAFCSWVIATGAGDTAKAVAFRRQLNEREKP